MADFPLLGDKKMKREFKLFLKESIITIVLALFGFCIFTMGLYLFFSKNTIISLLSLILILFGFLCMFYSRIYYRKWRWKSY